VDQFIQFLMQGEAPWWSALVGTVVGGLITYLTTKHTAREQRSADRIKADDDRLLADKEKWRTETIAHVSNMLVATYRLRNHILVSRRGILKKYPAAPVVSPEALKAFQTDLMDITETTLPILADLQRQRAILQITSDGDLAEAAVNLFLSLSDHHPQLSSAEFELTRDKASKAAALLMNLAKRELGFTFGSNTGVVAQFR
jgi:hypothetical protein